MKQKIKVYTTSICPYCITLKRFLEGRNIEYEEIDASNSEEIQNLIIEKTGKMSVPVVVFNDTWVQGFDRTKLIELLGLSE